MRPFPIAAIAAMIALGAPGSAQSQPKNSPVAAKPYKAVAVVPPKPVADPGLDALRQQVGEVAQKKDRGALTRLVVADGFFWDRGNGNGADKKKPGIDNLAAALGLASKDSVGWDLLAGYADDPTASALADHKGALCAPADPSYKAADLDALLDQTQTDISDWAYPVDADTEVRAAPQNTAPAIAKLGSVFVRVMPDANTVAPSFVRVIMPDGKAGYVSIDAIAPIGNDQLCYVKDGGVWKIGGYIGGGEPQ